MESAQTHVKVIAWIHILFGVLYVLGAVLAFTGFFSLPGLVDDNLAGGILNVSGSILGVILLGLGLPSLIGGIGLLGYHDWARILIIILSVLGLFNIPLGTFLSIYSLWVLFRGDTRRLFKGYSGVTDW
ncbi:MAG: hypothetical protein ICV83_29750 [Cytophagales bacterium]|nr:hypothetical protein [Cytophagales bacterium]